MMGSERPITLPVAPWDVPRVSEGDMMAGRSTPAPPHLRKLIRDTFRGEVSETDLKYMAACILQMSDEIFALRARVEALEAADCRGGAA